ncbi:LAFE_0E10198g1_1 [Lachancea fermentati]|uniref:LAFE_0E10198g1_1 n=1 Tax=Lachancea fermentati TaxID=4955 RepID=A0A1G4MDS6_LACFM|nr:LAFE_0E10198g1_1 [Lachancea fermentati]
MSTNNVKIVFGAYPLATLPQETSKEIIEILKSAGINELDTARIYPNSEKNIGELNLASEFLIDTKAVGFTPGSQTREGITKSFTESLSLLGVDSVEIYYLHCPDPEVPIEETLEAVDVFYKQGRFKRFGLSNFTPEDVQKVYDIAVEKGYALPTVYQGNYNAVARKIESDLFPVLRKLNIAFYAYSPIAGGFLAHTPDEITTGSKGRFDNNSPVGKLYQALYNRPKLIEALERWGLIAEKAGVTSAVLAYRWITYHSALDYARGDALIVGSRTPQQLRDTLKAIEDGPLDKNIVAEIDAVWERAKADAPVNNYTSLND